MHSLEHVSLNSFLDEKGLPAAELEKLVKSLLGFGKKVLPKKDQLAITTALEHITAMMADLILEEESADHRDNMHEHMRNVWMWHAIEETEHKGVTYDLYYHVGGNYAHRCFYMLVATAGLAIVSNYYHFRMLKASGNLFNFKDMFFGARKLYGFKGYVTRLIPIWFTYFKPGFHPWDHDNSGLIEKWKDQILKSADPKYLKKAH